MRSRTDFRSVFDYAVKHRKRLIIFFTDGFGTFPEKSPSIKTIWVTSPNGVPSKNFCLENIRIGAALNSTKGI